MDYGEHSTGTRDEHYNLISVLYHALHGADNCDHYALDAEAAGDERLAAFFREAQGAQMLLAERAKELLGISVSPSGVDVAPVAEDEVVEDIEEEEEVVEEVAPGGGTVADEPPNEVTDTARSPADPPAPDGVR